MQATTTLQQHLHHTLTTNGLTPRRAARLVRLLPDRGQHELMQALEQDPQNTFPRLAHMWIGDLADLLHTTWADARTAKKLFVTAVQR